jgi:sporulation protein YlmC with PRC-barrel domain
MQVQFMTQMQPNQMKASDLIGTRVISSNNESIGDINDVILDRNGQAMAAVVGVGGFLGIGEKNVAVPFNALEFATREQVSAMSNAGGNVTATGSTAAPGTAGGSTATGTSSTTAGTSASSDNEPERVILRMTKAELEAAPKFVEDADDANRSNTGSTGVSGQPATGTTTAPKQ